MAWIKRNLFFLIGSLVAVGLMGFGIYLLLAQINNENQVTEDIQKQYQELKRLKEQKPHPGNDKINNIKAAKDQQATLRGFIGKERDYFQRIPPIPDAATNKVTNADFAAELRNTVAQLRHSAQQQSVVLPPEYYFTFQSQKSSLKFDPGSLDLLAMHLGEIKAICDILFSAKINYLDSIQREIVSTNQDTNPSDYLTQGKTVSTPLADITPYQVSFRSFSAELAQVLAAFANSPCGYLIETINVEPANATELAGVGASATAYPQTYQPQPQPFSPGVGEGAPMRRFAPGYAPAPYPVAPSVATAPAAPRTSAFLNEKPFKVTLMIQIVKPRAVK